jgi:hypothetical protein
VPDFVDNFADKTPTDLRVSLLDLEHLTNLPNAWKQLHTLRVGYNALNENLNPLRDCPHASGLLRLILQEHDGTEYDSLPAVLDLFEQAAFRQLQVLRMEYFVGNEIDVINAACFRESLLEVYLHPYLSREEDQMKRFLSRTWPRLHTLHIGGNNRFWATFAKTKHLPNLCSLSIGSLGLKEPEIQAIAANPHMPHLSLIVNNCFDQREWLVREGRAYPVDDGVELYERNLFEAGSYPV